ncbi:MAG: insulinase family protein [Bacteroidetes bacterium]|jgi:zinc protease|nr:insulinase family protein [Bacteroidota bacterium]
MLDRKIIPTIEEAVHFDLQLKNCDRFTLDNKVPVYAMNAGAQDVVMVEWVFDAGNWYDKQPMVAATTNFLIKNGTTSKTAYQINDFFEFHGAYLNRSCYNETASITLHCLSKHLETLLPVVREIIETSIFPEEELAIYIQNQKQRLSVNLQKCDFIANRLIDEYLFGINHPYGTYSNAEDYDALNTDAIKAFYKQYYLNGSCKIFVAGKMPTGYEAMLNKAFGTLPLHADTPVVVEHPIVAAAQKKVEIINDENGVQGAIRMARPFPNRHHPDFQKAHVLNTLFGGFFGSRLMSNIREDKGYTYGIHSYFQNHVHASAWMISTEAGRDVCTATITEVLKEMELLRNELVDIEELDLVRNYMIGSLLGDLDGPFQLIGRWKNYVLNGLDENYFYKSIETIKSVTPQELQRLANTYLQPDDFYELVVI